MDQDTVIRKPDGGGVAILHLRGMSSPSWAHVKADYWIPANDLSLLCSSLRTSGRFFTDRYATNGTYLLIEEMEFDGTQDSVDAHCSRLVIIDIAGGVEAEVGRIDDGYCFPKRIDGEKITYSKMRRTESGIYREFERQLPTVTQWKQLGEQGGGADAEPAV